jgi:hypothetical protein
MAYTHDSFFKTLDPKSQKLLLEKYPLADYFSIVEYKYYPAIKLVVKKYDGTTSVFYL